MQTCVPSRTWGCRVTWRTRRPQQRGTRAAPAQGVRELPKPLPTPPKDATLFQVLPYLSSLAFGEPHMAIRVVCALAALLVAKAAGAISSSVFGMA